MQYVVNVSGKVANIQDKAYVVESNSKDEAKKIATKNFCEEFSTDECIITSNPRKRTKTAILSIILMIIPVLLSLINWKNVHSTISISPDLISCLYGVAIYGSFVVRFKGVQRTVLSWIDILLAIVSSLLLATFIKAILIESQISFFGICKFDINTNIILIVSVLLSWLGLKAISLVCMGVVIVCALSNITNLNAAMGFIWGPIYVICSFIGIISYIAIEPAFMESRHFVKNFTKNRINHLNNDVIQAKSNVLKVKNNISKKDNNSGE